MKMPILYWHFLYQRISFFKKLYINHDLLYVKKKIFHYFFVLISKVLLNLYYLFLLNNLLVLSGISPRK